MPKCPNCKAELDHLHHFPHMEIRHLAKLDADGDLESWPDPDSEWCQTDDDEFECPECNLLLFTKWCDAENFLKEWDADD